MQTVWHVATHTTNIGDAALIHGLQGMLREDTGLPLSFHNDSLMDYANYWGRKQYDRALVDKINASSDLLLIGGGGMMDGGRQDRNAGIGFDLPLNLLAQIKKPVVFYAVGHNSFPAQRYRHAKQLLKLIKTVTSNERMLFSVRNDGTLERLRVLLDDGLDGVQEIPDPGMFVPVEDTTHNCLLDGKINILIQLAGDNPFNRFQCQQWKHVPLMGPAVLRRKVRTFFRQIGVALQRIADEYPVNYVLCPHLVRDFTIMGEFVSSITPAFSRFTFNGSETLRGIGGAPLFYDLYKKAAMVVGMRGHSVICSVGLGTPIVALSSHDKIEGFMRAVGLADRIVRYAERDAGDKLYGMMREILQNRNMEKERLKEIRRSNRAKSAAFHQKIHALLQG